MQVSEGNVLAHLGIIEQRTNEILQVSSPLNGAEKQREIERERERERERE